MAFDLPNSVDMTNSNGFIQFLFYLNSVTHGWFANMLLIGIYLIVLAGYYKTNDNDFPAAFAVAGFVTFIFGLLFWLGGGIHILTLGIIVAMLILGVVILLVATNN